MAEPVIEVRGLTKRFGSVTAVAGLDFSVHSGTVTGFLGPNGAGKTTTLRMLLGLVGPTAGQALINGRSYRDLHSPSRVVGAVLESSGFHPARSARSHLRTVATAAGFDLTRVDSVLELVGLSEVAGHSVGGYSSGMRQRLELARAMLGSPEILILDEPANGLDPKGIAWLRTLLRDFAARGGLVLVSSHLLAEVANTVDELIVLKAGRLVGQGPLASLLQGPSHTVRVRCTEPDRLLASLAAAGITATRENSAWVVAQGSTPEAVGSVMAGAAIVVLEMTASGESLEDLFFEMTETGDSASGQPEGAAALSKVAS